MQRHFIVLAVVILALIALAVGVSAQEMISPGTPVESTLAGASVTYSVDASAGQLLIISMSSEEIDSRVSVELDGNELGSDDDSGGYPDALLAFLAPQDGSFDVVAGSFGDETGAFTLQVDVVSPTMIGAGSSAILEPAGDGSQALYGVLDGVEGQVVNVRAMSQGEEDIRLRLVGSDGEDIEDDDDDGPGYNPLLRRVVLPATGPNLIVVTQAFSDEPILAPVEVSVDETEQIFLSAEPQAMPLGDGEGQFGTEVYTVEMAAGTTYRFIVTIPEMPDDEGGVQLELLDTDRFFEPDLEAQHATRVAWDYTATSSGTARLVVHPNFFSDDLHMIEYTIAMEVIE